MRVIGIKVLSKDIIPSGVDVGGQEKTDVPAQVRDLFVLLTLFCSTQTFEKLDGAHHIDERDLLYSVYEFKC